MQIQVETAALADAAQKAARIAPTKGDAFDKSKGIMLELDGDTLVVRSCDNEITYLQRVRCTVLDDEDPRVRVPSSVFAQLMNQMPVGTDTLITTDASVSEVSVSCLAVDTTLKTIDPSSFPQFGSFAGKYDLVNVDEFGDAVAHVKWATKKNSIPLEGVHIDGDQLVATDGVKASIVDLTVPVEEPVTVPISVLSPILQRGAVSVGATKNRFLMAIGDHTEISAVLYATAYPNIDQLAAVFGVADNEVNLPRPLLSAALDRMAVLSTSGRMTTVDITIDNDLMLIEGKTDVGDMSESITIDVVSGCETELKVRFSVDELRSVMNAATSDTLDTKFKDAHSPWTFRNSSFRSLLMPMRVVN